MHRLFSTFLLSLLLCTAPLAALADGPAAGAVAAGGLGGTASSATGSTYGSTYGLGTAPGTVPGYGAAPSAATAPGYGYAAPGMSAPSTGYGAAQAPATISNGTGFGPLPGTAQPSPGYGQPTLSPSPQPSGSQVTGAPQGSGGAQSAGALPGSPYPAGMPAPGTPGFSPSSIPQGGLANYPGAAGGNAAAVTNPALNPGEPGARNGLRWTNLPEPSRVEKQMAQEQLGKDQSQPQQAPPEALTQFGYSFFKPDAAGFSPITDAPVGPDYLIGVGDRLVITLWGSVDGTFEVEVNRSGEIALPKIGTIRVAGASFGDLPGLIRANLARVIKDFHLTVNMGKLRMIKVYLVGEVNTPGDYTITSLSTLLNALSAAGGPTKNGSLRNIQIKRAGRLVESVDLYDFFLKGDKSRDIRLQPGDTVFVPVLGPVVGVAGNVRRPGIYELKGEKTLGEVLALAEGINPTGYLQRVQILRVQAHDKKMVADFSLDPKLSGRELDQMTAGIGIQDTDLVKIFPIDSTLRGYVRLTGYVLRTGDYALKPGMKLSSLLVKDVMLPEYYREAGEITRLVPPDYHPEVSYFNVSKAMAGDPKEDLELKEFDTVKIFSRWEKERMPRVRIGGEIQSPGEYRLFDNMTVRDLVIQAGNPTLTAYLKNAEIDRINKDGARVTSHPIAINLEEALKGNPKDNLPLSPFDEITIRKIPDWAEETDRYITLKGEFVFPGTYPIYKGERLSHVIERAGGFTDKAYLKAAKFTRKSIQEDQQKRMDEMIAKTEVDITKKQGELSSVASSTEELQATKSSLEGLMRTAERLKSAKAEGRMVLKLSPLAQFKGTTYDVELMGGDTLYVPITPNSVNVIGQVYNPTAFVLVPDGSVSDYLSRAGGANRDAETDDMYIVRADGSVESRQAHQGFLFFNSFGSTRLEAGDTLVVPTQIERTAWMREIKDIATILGQIALTAGVMVAAGL